jgi:hypothetical protein
MAAQTGGIAQSDGEMAFSDTGGTGEDNVGALRPTPPPIIPPSHSRKNPPAEARRKRKSGNSC